MIINRYIIKEVLLTLFAVLAVLLLIFMGSFFARFLGFAAEGFISNSIVLDLMGLKTLSALNVMLPFSLYLSVLIAFGRLYKDSEMTALSASGIGIGSVLQPILQVSIVFMLIVGALSFYISPWALDKVLQLQEQTEAKAQLDGIVSGQFAQLKSERKPVFYAESLSDDKKSMNNVFVQIREPDNTLVIYSASSGYQTDEDATGERFFVLNNGRRYQLTPGDNQVNIQVYKKSAFRIEEKGVVTKSRDKNETPTASLLAKYELADIAELQWRVAMPLSALLLPILAALLSRTSPRQGRFSKLFLAIIIFIFYNNALGLSRSWIESRELSPVIGLWWTHCLLVILIIHLYARHSGWYIRKRTRQLLVEK